MTKPPYELDVRPILRDGGEPFSAIMQAVASLAPGQGLRLLATFKPLPLFQVLGARGFEPAAREIGNGDWEVVFTPAGGAPSDGGGPPEAEVAQASPPGLGDGWPAPVQDIDCRDLTPPEPMVKTLEAVEALQSGETLAALLPREPRFLFPQLDARGHLWRGQEQPDGTYRIVIRHAQKADAP
jgi:uncharacterized protein (DUF2249 family)